MRPFLWMYGNLKRKMLCIYDGFFPYQVINGESSRDEDIYIYDLSYTDAHKRETAEEREGTTLLFFQQKKSGMAI